MQLFHEFHLDGTFTGAVVGDCIDATIQCTASSGFSCWDLTGERNP
jgi:hypothetical protein